MRRKVVVIIAVVLVLGVCAVVGLNYMENYDEFYYAQIDNSKVEELSPDKDMNYEYTLDCYDENGKKRELDFKTSRKLKEGGYVSLEVRSLGVHKWEGIQYNDLPQKVQECLK